MAIPSVYINLEDDIGKIVARLRHQSSGQIVLVCPKRCLLFTDGVNLKLLKEQTDLLGKEVFILTMDERGQQYAKAAGFGLKYLPKSIGPGGFSDVRPMRPPAKRAEAFVLAHGGNQAICGRKTARYTVFASGRIS